jgi:uncharacterized protein (TIRG00374 family)
MRKKVITIILLAVNLAIIVAIGFVDPHLKELGGAFRRLDMPWVIGGFALMFVFWSMDAFKFLVSLHVTSKVPHRFFSYLKIAIIGQYYGAITPFATGGQPMQVYYFSKYGVPGGTATSVLIMQYVILLICHCLFYVVAFITKSGLILSRAAGVFPFAVLGLILILGLLFTVLAMASHNQRLKRILFCGLRLFHRLKIVKRPLQQWRRLHHAVDDFQKGLRLQQGNWKTMILLFLLTIIQLTCFFSIPYFVYRSFVFTPSALATYHLTPATWLDMTLVSAFLQVMVSYFPTPGASGASEGGFYVFYPIFFPAPLIFIAMLMWRILSYYLNIVVGGILVFLDGILHIARDRIPDAGEEPAQNA